jgi:alpha-1,3/alpha-1,6-mannosyltransferase
MAKNAGLETFVWDSNVIPQKTNVLFLASFTDDQRTYLLANSICLVYTPSEEHFGIVPLEAMYSSLPVIAVNSGGPKETVLDGRTGYLCDPTPISFADCLTKLLDHPEIHLFGQRGRDHVRQKFSLKIFTDQLEETVFFTKDLINVNAALTYYSVLFLLSCLLPILVLNFLIYT